MTTPGPDPRFPNRPDHPDFWRLSKAVIDTDDAADQGMPIETIMANLGITSPDSVAYMAEQRMLRAVGHNFVSPQSKALLMGLWLDAFVAGVGFVGQDTLDALRAVKAALDAGDGRLVTDAKARREAVAKAEEGLGLLCERLGVDKATL